MARHGRRVAGAVTAVVAVMVTMACGSSKTPGRSPEGPPAMPAGGTATVQVGGRSVTVHVPTSYAADRPAPLVVALHGYTSDGKQLENYLRLTPEADRRGFVYAYPDGTMDARGDRFWNATDACCAFYNPKPDDSRYLSDLITTIERAYRIDPARVYLIGHSNGGFMAFRMACEHADQIAAIVSLNGASAADAAQCRPSAPVSVLAIKSTTDETVAFGGGAINGVAYPSATTTVRQWLDHDRCAPAGRAAPSLDLVSDLPGAETSVRTYVEGCAGGSAVESWTIKNGSHGPTLGPAFAPAVTGFLLSRSRPAR